MNHLCHLGGGCILVKLGMAVLWWLLASALLWQTWNRVIGSLGRVKAARYWQALLFVATLLAFIAPMRLLKSCNRSPCHQEGACSSQNHDCSKHDCSRGEKCHHEGKEEAAEDGSDSKKEKCPYSKPDQNAKAPAAKAE